MNCMMIVRKILSKVKKLLKKSKVAVYAAIQAFKFGGVSSYSIKTVNYSNILEGKRILITGGSSGIGLALAKKCAELGGLVLITGRDQSKINQVISDIGYKNLLGLRWDVSKIAEINGQLDICRSILGGDIDVLVNNAGVIDTTSFFDVTEAEWDKIYATNSKGLFFLTQAVCKYWVKNKIKPRKVINISSQGGYVGATYPYRMSKWDIKGLTQGLGLKLCNSGIIVNGIAPGIVATSMQPESQRQKENIFCPHNPLKRFALPEEIAELGVFLISDASNFIVGQTILCDGGFTIK